MGVSLLGMIYNIEFLAVKTWGISHETESITELKKYDKLTDVVSIDKVIGVIKDELELNDLLQIKMKKNIIKLNLLSILLSVVNVVQAYMLYSSWKYLWLGHHN